MTQVIRLALLSVLAALLAAAFAPVAQAQGPACTISWDGGADTDAWFDVDDPSPAPNDEIYNWSPERYPTSTDHACFPPGAVANTNLVTQNTPDVRSFTISPGATLSVTQVQMIVRENSLNAGTLNMSGPVPVSVSDGDPADHETLTNTGMIHFTSGGTAGLRAITGDLLNQGTIDVDHPEASIQAASPGAPAVGNQTNQGTIDISAGNALRSILSNFVNSTGGVITGAGSMNMDGARFEAASGGSIGAATDVNMTNSIFAGAPGSTGTGRIDIVGAFSGGGPSTLEGTVPAGITLDVDGGVTLRAPAVTTTVNAGRINLTGDGPSNGSQLQVLPNDTQSNSTSKLTNAPTGVIEFTSGGNAGFKFITGNLVNQGSILVNHPQARFQSPGGTNTPPRLTNNGTISISSGNVLAAIQSPEVINGQGGVISGAGALNHDGGKLTLLDNGQISPPLDYNLSGAAALDLTSASAASGNVDIVNNSSNLTGNVPSGISIDVRGATLRSLTSFTNAGTITVDRVTGDSAEAVLSTEDGNGATIETLTNTGTIAVTGNLGTPRLAGDLLNQGTLAVSNSAAVRFEALNETRSGPLPKLTNAAGATLTVAAGSTLALVPGAAQNLANVGTVNVNGSLNPIGFTQTGGTTTLAAGSALNLSPPETAQLQGGVLRGSGNITGGDVVNSGGTLAPGTSPGVLSLTDDYVQGAGGNLAIEVSGASAGTGHDQLVVGGTASLAGTLVVDTANFTPATGQQFKVIDAPAPPASPTVSGGFATVVENGRDYDVTVNPTDVTLTALTPPADPPQPPVVTPSDPPVVPPVVTPTDPPAGDQAACETAKEKLAKAKRKLKKLKRKDASKQAIKRAKRKVAKAKEAVRQACG